MPLVDEIIKLISQSPKQGSSLQVTAYETALQKMKEKGWAPGTSENYNIPLDQRRTVAVKISS